MAKDFCIVSDSDLFEMCLRGDEGAWKYVYNFILNIARLKGRNLKQEPDDIAQMVVTSLIEGGLKKVKEKESFRGFLRKITVNKIIDISRTPIETRENSIDEPVESEEGTKMEQSLTSTDCSPEDELINKNTMEIIRFVLNDLKEECKKILKEYFRYKLGYYESYQELGKILKKPIGTISVQVKRCMEKFNENKKIKELAKSK
ncbi:MAG: hypothetical protein A2042_07405 [Candidatus Schekmanbacteria bacterium GWA2_38_11]|uniref:RNA polymerase sigma-70 region 2 domain-containing protein n=1 Tax=Candidatus Schekmanbacteria bacterium GWA2_38_11 TaxID=1817876 RepID=A0A1F7RNA3_9BACT|nr:MAG: hypothetical protein A2042_07405 [Candidatus Schekmanbacteria bacterium GWA2_38_11]